jgi:hypothetical protein
LGFFEITVVGAIALEEFWVSERESGMRTMRRARTRSN